MLEGNSAASKKYLKNLPCISMGHGSAPGTTSAPEDTQAWCPQKQQQQWMENPKGTRGRA